MSPHILITRDDSDSAKWVDELAMRGFVAVARPCIETETIATQDVRHTLAASLAGAEWLVFTSKRGVTATAELLDEPLPPGVNIAAVGATTRTHAELLFDRPALVADEATAVGLGTTMCRKLEAEKTGPIVLAVAENAGPILEETLTDAGFAVQRVDVYRTLPRRTAESKLPLSSTGCDTVFLASPSAVEGFMNEFTLDTPARIVTIGPSTTSAARGSGLDVFAEAAEPSLEGMLEATER
jgi:uroporphyrinogen-III synthase